jgi:transposase
MIKALKHLGLSSSFAHLDSSSFHTEGQHNQGETPVEGVIHITRDYSRDHRPDLNQVVLQLICERQAGIPLLMQPLIGNSCDKDSFRNTINRHIEQLHSDFNIDYIVADSAMYTAETLQDMSDFLWISRVPETLTQAREMIHTKAPNLMNHLAQPAWCGFTTTYGTIKPRWVVVYSPQAYQRALKTLNKECLKQSTSEFKQFSQLCQPDFAGEAEAFSALNAFEKKLKITYVVDRQVNALPHYQNKGRPASDQKPDFYRYRIHGNLALKLAERIRRLERKSCFILATNQLDNQALSDEELIAAYKNQPTVERGFRFLKDPLFMASTLFLKSPQCIMALMMVMTLCLVVYAALEYRIREALKAHHETFPNQKGQAISNPTARWVFQSFGGIHVLVIEPLHSLVLNLNPHHLRLLKLLGPRYQQLYSASGFSYYVSDRSEKPSLPCFN